MQYSKVTYFPFRYIVLLLVIYSLVELPVIIFVIHDVNLHMGPKGEVATSVSCLANNNDDDDGEDAIFSDANGMPSDPRTRFVL